MTRIYIIMLVSCIALLLAASGTAAAQEVTTVPAPTETTTAAAPTTVSEPPNETMHYGDVAGDRAVWTVSVEYVDGTAVLMLESDPPRTVTVIVPTDSASTGAATGNLIRRPILSGRTAIRVDSPEPRVIPVTSYSVENGRCTETRFDDDGSAFIASLFIGTGVWDTAIGGVLGTSFGALLIIVRRRSGLHRDMEHVA